MKTSKKTRLLHLRREINLLRNRQRRVYDRVVEWYETNTTFSALAVMSRQLPVGELTRTECFCDSEL